MKKPERQYNLLSCLILGIIGTILVGLIATGMIFPVTVYMVNLLPSGNLGIPAEVSRALCHGVAYGVPIALLVIWFLRRRSRPGSTSAEQLEPPPALRGH